MIPDLYFYGNGGCPKIDGRKYKEKQNVEKIKLVAQIC